MFLAIPLGEFASMFQVLLMIVIPILIFSILTTVAYHYRRKGNKKNAKADETMHAFVGGSSPENFCYRTDDGQFVYLDHTGLLKEYRKQLSYSHARYAALQQDIKKLRSISGASVFDKIWSIHSKKTTMEHFQHSTSEPMDQHSGQSLVTPGPGNEQDYLNDLLEEKKKQIAFLQDQIDLRIRSFHEVDKVLKETKARLEESEKIRLQTDEVLTSLQTNHVIEQQAVNDLRSSLEEKHLLLSGFEQKMEAKDQQLVYLENQLQEFKDQNQLLNAVAADAEDKNTLLQSKLELEESKVSAMEQKLASNKRLLQRLYSEFSACMLEETEASPVIQLRTDYKSNEWEEVVVQ